MEYEIKSKEKLRVGIKELWLFRELFYFFTWRDIKVKYKQTVLGFTWVVLQPLLMMIIFSFFFGTTLKIPSDNLPYPIFVYSGLLLWNFFASGITSSGNSMINNAGIIKKIYFPRLIIPISAILVSLFDFFMAFLIFIGLLVYYSYPVDLLKIIIFMPLGLVITIITTFGLGALLAALNIKYRDFRYIIPFLVQALLFLTPVIYPISILSNKWIQYIIAVNPMYCAIELFRNGIIDKPIQMNLCLISLISSAIFFIVGLYYFRKTETYFADLS